MAFPKGGWVGRGQGNFLSLKWETILKADEPQFGQRHEDVGKKREYYHIIFPEKTWNCRLHHERRGQVKTIVMEHFNGILFHKSGPANKQDTNQPTIP